MESFSHSSYPDSGDSSPRSREIDENQAWDEPAAANNNYKVKLMCSYGGKIQPRPHDNQLTYIGGDTKILAVDRNVKFSVMMNKLASLCGDTDICFKYQLPGEDLDALISVTNDEDLEHMMVEYDRLHRASAKPARLRLFLFRLKPPGAGSNGVESDRQWFVDALNSFQVLNLDASTPRPPAVAAVVSSVNPDFLFGLDNGFSPITVTKLVDSAPAPPTVPEVASKDISAGSDCGSEGRVGDPGVNQRIQDFQRLQIAGGNGYEQVALSRKMDYSNIVADNAAPPQAPVAMPAQPQIPIPAGYRPEWHFASVGVPLATATTADPPVYLLPTAGAARLYQAPPLMPVRGEVGQGFYGVQRVGQEVYQEPWFGAMPFQSQQQVQPKDDGKVGMVVPELVMVERRAAAPTLQAKVGVADQGYPVGYDSSGRQVYYTNTAPYQAAARMEIRPSGGGALNQDAKIATNATPSQTSSA